MPTSLKATPVSFHNGQKRINLRAALETKQYKTSSVEMTFGELARAYLAVHYNGADMQLRKWIDLLHSRSAWEVGSGKSNHRSELSTAPWEVQLETV